MHPESHYRVQISLSSKIVPLSFSSAQLQDDSYPFILWRGRNAFVSTKKRRNTRIGNSFEAAVVFTCFLSSLWISPNNTTLYFVQYNRRIYAFHTLSFMIVMLNGLLPHGVIFLNYLLVNNLGLHCCSGPALMILILETIALSDNCDAEMQLCNAWQMRYITLAVFSFWFLFGVFFDFAAISLNTLHSVLLTLDQIRDSTPAKLVGLMVTNSVGCPDAGRHALLRTMGYRGNTLY